MLDNTEWNENMVEDSQLEAAAGGNATIGDRHFSDQVDSMCAVPGENYFILLNDGRNWMYGTLTENCDEDVFGFKHERVLVFQNHIINGSYTEVPNRYKASIVTLYRNCLTLAQGKF